MRKKALTPGQKKLASLGIQLPLLPTTSTGSLPKQADLIELRYKVAKGVQQPSELERKEKLSTEIWVRHQEKMGLDVLVDGEMYRGDLVNFFAQKIQGYQEGGTVRCFGNRYYRKPIVKGKLEWKGTMTVEMWRFAQRLTHRPLKAVITGPYTMMDWSFNEYYPSRESLCRDLTEILHQELKALVDAGAKIIQIDEPAISSRPDEFSLVQDTIKDLVRGLNAYFILHHSYGDLSKIWQKMQRLPFDNFHLEMANSNFSFLPLIKKFPTPKDLSIGVMDCQNRVVETLPEIRRRLRSVLSVVPVSQLWIAPDAGLKMRTFEESAGKLETLIEAALKQRQAVKQADK